MSFFEDTSRIMCSFPSNHVLANDKYAYASKEAVVNFRVKLEEVEGTTNGSEIRTVYSGPLGKSSMSRRILKCGL